MKKCSTCANRAPGLNSCFLLINLCGNDANWMNWRPLKETDTNAGEKSKQENTDFNQGEGGDR